MMTVEFLGPDEGPPERRKTYRSEYTAIRRELAALPGQWAIVAQGEAGSSGAYARCTRVAAGVLSRGEDIPGLRFETRVRTDRHEGTVTTYARAVEDGT